MTASVKIETILRGTRRSRAVKRGAGVYRHAWLHEATIVVEAERGEIVDLMLLEEFDPSVAVATGDMDHGTWTKLGYYLPDETPTDLGTYAIEFEQHQGGNTDVDELLARYANTPGPDGVSLRNALRALRFFHQARSSLTTIRLIPNARNEPVQTVWVQYVEPHKISSQAIQALVKPLRWWRRWNPFSRDKLPKALLQERNA